MQNSRVLAKLAALMVLGAPLTGAIAPVSNAQAAPNSTANGTFVEDDLIAYRAMYYGARYIAWQVLNNGPKDLKTVVIFDEKDAQSLITLRDFESQVEFLNARYDAAFVKNRDIAPPVSSEPNVNTQLRYNERTNRSVTASNARVTVETESVGEALALPRAAATDLRIAAAPLETVTPTSVISELSRQFQAQGITVYSPALAPLGSSWTYVTDGLLGLQKLQEKKVRANYRIRELRAAVGRTNPNFDAERSQRLHGSITEHQALNAALDALVASVNAVGLTNSAALTRAASVRDLLARDASTHMLRLDVAKSGGSNIIRNKRLKHSGGAIVSYMLFDREGNLKLSGNSDQYFGFADGLTLGRTYPAPTHN